MSAGEPAQPPPGPRFRRAVLGLGSNLGDRLESLQGAVDALADTPGCAVVAISPVYETEPVGGPEQPPYLNAVVIVDTWLAPDLLLVRGQAIEEAFDRLRTVRWGPRTLDVDLLVYAESALDSEELTLPHPRAHERAFVLAPWADLDPTAELPGRGRVADLLIATGTQGVRRRTDLELRLPA